VTAPLVVYDTMLFLQAALNPNRRYATFDAAADGRLVLCISPDLMSEALDVLSRPGLAARFPALTANRISEFLKGVSEFAVLYRVVPKRFTWPQHPDDDHIFNLAIHAGAKHLVTWETRIVNLPDSESPSAIQLRSLAPELSIVTPKQLAESLRLTDKQ